MLVIKKEGHQLCMHHTKAMWRSYDSLLLLTIATCLLQIMMGVLHYIMRVKRATIMLQQFYSMRVDVVPQLWIIMELIHSSLLHLVDILTLLNFSLASLHVIHTTLMIVDVQLFTELAKKAIQAL